MYAVYVYLAEAAGANAKYYKHRKQPLAPDVKKTLSKQRIQEKYGHGNAAEETDDRENVCIHLFFLMKLLF